MGSGTVFILSALLTCAIVLYVTRSRRKKQQSDWRQSAKAKIWASRIRKRDRTCALCKARKKLHAHHVLPASLFPEYRYCLWNGIALCGEHHRLLHERKLDLKLLPTMYRYRSRHKPAHEALRRNTRFRALASYYGGECSSKVLREACNHGSYRKAVFKMHPSWARRIFKD